jgi:hypothetical protein
MRRALAGDFLMTKVEANIDEGFVFPSSQKVGSLPFSTKVHVSGHSFATPRHLCQSLNRVDIDVTLVHPM